MKRRTMIISIAVAICLSVQAWVFIERNRIRTIVDPPPHGIILPSGYYHRTRRGIDSIVGTIWKSGGPEIEYDIGPYGAFKLADGEKRDRFHEYEWVKEEKSNNGQKMMIGFEKNGWLAVTFDNDYYCFYAKVKSQDEIDEIIAILRTFR